MASPTSSTTLVVFNAVSGNSAVHNEASSFDLDSFDFSKAMAQLAFKNTNATMPSNPSDLFSRLPKHVLKKVLGLLLISTKPLVLGVDEDAPVSDGLELAILRSSHYVYTIATEILYGCNNFTASSPATSFDFDKDLLQLPGKNLQLIRHIRLEIDWADKLWAKFPLIASVLGSIRGLKSLKIIMVPKAHDHVIEEVVKVADDEEPIAHASNADSKSYLERRGVKSESSTQRIFKAGSDGAGDAEGRKEGVDEIGA